MDATIVIPTKNAGELLDKVLKKITSQKTKYKYEVICVDSGSSDRTIEIIKKNKCKLYEIKPSQFGHGKTRNYGASKGTGRYIVFLTQDALPINNNWLDSFIKEMDKNKDAAGAFGKHLPYDGCNIFDARDINGLFEGFGKETKEYKIDDKKRYKEEEGYRHFLAFYSDNNSCMRREIWEKIPYDDVDFAEDQLWAKKIIEKGYSKLYCPTAVVYHSHNYKLKTYFSRYYDEYKGLYKLHKYFLVESRKQQIVRCLKHIEAEILYTYRDKKLSLKNKLYWMYYSVRRNIYRYKAGYLAYKYQQVSISEKLKMDEKYSQQFQQINRR